MAKSAPQAGVVPVRDGLVCLITSSNGRRWVAPKGNVDPGHTPAQAAAIEAWEEAGLTGTLEPEPLGEFEYEKYGAARRVAVFLMRVADAADDWPEARLRTREWLTPEEAMARVAEPGLRRLIALAAGRVAVGV